MQRMHIVSIKSGKMILCGDLYFCPGACCNHRCTSVQEDTVKFDPRRGLGEGLFIAVSVAEEGGVHAADTAHDLRLGFGVRPRYSGTVPPHRSC
jgi:hypothetical protein